MQIGEVTERVQLSHRTVRHDDDEGLATPVRSAGNFRLYTGDDVQRLLLIRQLQPLGFSPDDMRRFIAVSGTLRDDPDDEEAREQLCTFVDTAQQRRDKMAAQVKTTDVWLKGLRTQL
jgi:DNA-binding transcriptional MerR regulator